MQSLKFDIVRFLKDPNRFLGDPNWVPPDCSENQISKVYDRMVLDTSLKIYEALPTLKERKEVALGLTTLKLSIDRFDDVQNDKLKQLLPAIAGVITVGGNTSRFTIRLISRYVSYFVERNRALTKRNSLVETIRHSTEAGSTSNIGERIKYYTYLADRECKEFDEFFDELIRERGDISSPSPRYL